MDEFGTNEAEMDEFDEEINGHEARGSVVLRKAVLGLVTLASKVRRPALSRKLLAPMITLLILAMVASLTATLMPGKGGDKQIPPAQAESVGPIPTNIWANFYGLNCTVDGKPLPVGVMITARDPQGTVCGEFVVTEAGRYGVMPVYGDDPLTEVDEGAVFGDWLVFYVNGVEATVAGPDEAVWIAMGDLRQVNLIVFIP